VTSLAVQLDGQSTVSSLVSHVSCLMYCYATYSQTYTQTCKDMMVIRAAKMSLTQNRLIKLLTCVVGNDRLNLETTVPIVV